jgi:hypothetical protein
MNLKSQITNSKSQTNPNDQNFNVQNLPVLVIGELEFGYCLEFGAWNLEIRQRRIHGSL